MISWDREEVARFLGVQPQQPHGEDTEYVFAFDSGDQRAQLTVQPYNDYAIVTLGRPGEREGHAQFRMDCTTITLEAGDTAGSAPSLVLHAPSLAGGGADLSCWIRITPADDGFRIESSFALEEGSQRRLVAVPRGRRPVWGCAVVILLIAAGVALLGLIIPLLTG